MFQSTTELSSGCQKNLKKKCKCNYKLYTSFVIVRSKKLLKIRGCLTVHLPHEIMWNATLMHQGNFINTFLARHVSGTYAHHQEH